MGRRRIECSLCRELGWWNRPTTATTRPLDLLDSLPPGHTTGMEGPDDVLRQWRHLTDPQRPKPESDLQKFLEAHPEFLPGAHTLEANSGHQPWPRAVISQPPLPDLSTKLPDFMWISMDSLALYPTLIEIETPWKLWWHRSGVSMHSDLTRALTQVMHWRMWFADGVNHAKFYRYYRISRDLQDLTLSPRYLVIHGNRTEANKTPEAIRARANISVSDDTRLMTFDRLTPDPRFLAYGTVTVDAAGFHQHPLGRDWTARNPRDAGDAEPPGYRFAPPGRRT
jgi:hypothetical protein